MAPDRTRLRLRVSPGVSSTARVGRHEEAWKLRVAAPPEDGRANDAVVRLLAERLGIGRADVTLVAGHGSRDKVVELAGVAPAEVARRLEASS